MDTVIKKRCAYYCNLKAFLIFLVVYGHLIEPQIRSSRCFLQQYRMIYAVHMPLFAFLSGMFLKEQKACLAQMRSAGKYYLIFQSAYLAWARIFGKGSLLLPYWHLWYLLSLACWAGICLLSDKILLSLASHLKNNRLREGKVHGVEKALGAVFVLVLAAAGCAAGNADWIGRECSLSRTIVFLPYVMAGKLVPAETVFRKYRAAGLVSGLLSVSVLILVQDFVPVKFFYQADSYVALGLEHGPVLRLISYAAAWGCMLFILAFTPWKRSVISKIGIDTFWIYIFHAPLVRMVSGFVSGSMAAVPLALILTALILLFLYEAFRWKEKLCRIENAWEQAGRSRAELSGVFNIKRKRAAVCAQENGKNG